jgi:hypothetical protein
MKCSKCHKKVKEGENAYCVTHYGKINEGSNGSCGGGEIIKEWFYHFDCWVKMIAGLNKRRKK